MAAIVDSVRPLERFPVDTDLTEEYLKKSDNLSKETPENRAEKLQELLRLINEYPDLSTRTDDIYLLRFLRAKYFHPKHAFNLLKSYEEFKLKHGDFFMTIDVPIFRSLTLSGAVQVLPYRDQFQSRVFWLRAAFWKPSECSIDHLLQVGGVCGDATIVEPMTQCAGIIMIFDLKDVGMAHVKSLTPSFAKKMVHFLSACLPVRVNAIHVINEPTIFTMAFSVFKAFLTDKMKKRLHFHGSNMQSLHEHVTPSCLPPEMGGTAGEIVPEEWYKVLMGDMVYNELKQLGYKFINEDNNTAHQTQMKK